MVLVRLTALDLAGFHALRADIHLLRRAIDHDRHLLDVRMEHAIGDTVRVADVATRGGMFTAHAADLRHLYRLLHISKRPGRSLAKSAHILTC